MKIGVFFLNFEMEFQRSIPTIRWNECEREYRRRNVSKVHGTTKRPLRWMLLADLLPFTCTPYTHLLVRLHWRRHTHTQILPFAHVCSSSSTIGEGDHYRSTWCVRFVALCRFYLTFVCRRRRRRVHIVTRNAYMRGWACAQRSNFRVAKQKTKKKSKKGTPHRHGHIVTWSESPTHTHTHHRRRVRSVTQLTTLGSGKYCIFIASASHTKCKDDEFEYMFHW